MLQKENKIPLAFSLSGGKPDSGTLSITGAKSLLGMTLDETHKNKREDKMTFNTVTDVDGYAMRVVFRFDMLANGSIGKTAKIFHTKSKEEQLLNLDSVEVEQIDETKTTIDAERHAEKNSANEKPETGDQNRDRKNSIPLSKEKAVEVPSMSAIVGKGELIFRQGDGPDKLKISISTTTPIIQGKGCSGCAKIIKIDPNLKIAIKPFLSDYEVKGQYIGTEESTQLELTDSNPTDAKEFIMSGPAGATLQKEGKRLRLMEGEAHLLILGD